MASVQAQMAENASNLSIFVASSANSSTDGDSSYISVEGGDFPVQYLIGRYGSTMLLSGSVDGLKR